MTIADAHVLLAVLKSLPLPWGLHLDTQYPLALPCRPD